MPESVEKIPQQFCAQKSYANSVTARPPASPPARPRPEPVLFANLIHPKTQHATGKHGGRSAACPRLSISPALHARLPQAHKPQTCWCEGQEQLHFCGWGNAGRGPSGRLIFAALLVLPFIKKYYQSINTSLAPPGVYLRVITEHYKNVCDFMIFMWSCTYFFNCEWIYIV